MRNDQTEYFGIRASNRARPRHIQGARGGTNYHAGQDVSWSRRTKSTAVLGVDTPALGY